LKPILYNKNETRFDTYGLGEIDALKGNATRERNGNYSAYLEYPASGPLASVFEKEMKFKADAGTRTKNQTFEIVRIVKDSSSTIKIYAQHISHKLEYMSVRHGIKVSGTADLALKTWAKNLIGDYRFDTWSDIDTVLPVTFLVDKMENARLALGGVEGSILDIWGGEYEFDNQTVRLHKRLGRRAPTVLEYGRNILSAESDESIESAYTSVVPFATYTPESQEGDSRQQEPVLVTIPEGYVDSKYVSMYANRRIKVVDFSSEFKDEGTGESKKKDIPTPEKLKELAVKYMDNNRIGAPKINTKIEYVDLAQTLDYAEHGWIEELELCDIVPVYYPEIGITEDDAKVTKVVYDFLNDRNESVEFGLVGESIRSAMTGGLAGRLDDLEKNQQSLENRQSEMAFELPKYLLDAKGNRVWNETPDENIEHKVGDIWFEKNGLYQRLYIWNGEMWEKRIDTEDVSKVGEKFDAEVKKINQSMATQTQQTTQALRSAGANASAIEAAKDAITKLNQDLAGAKQTNQAAIDRLKSDFANAQKTASDQTALLKSDFANIRTKQSQAESEIAKQVAALNAAKSELANVKSAQATYEQTTTRRLAELVNVADGKASKSELTQTAEELSSKIASVQASGRNLFLNSLFKQDIRKAGILTTSTYTATIDDTNKYLGHNALKIVGQDPAGKDGGNPKITYPATGQYGKVAPGSMTNQEVTISFYAKAENVGTILRSRLGYIGFKDGNVTLTTEVKRYVVKFSRAWTGLSNLTTNEWLFNLNRADTVWIWIPKFEVSDTDTPYSEAPEDVENQISAVESSFKQRADSLEAGVNRLTEGLKTKADSSALTLLSDRILASVKSLETDTDNKLNQKLSTAEFDVRASGIRQEILNATKDKADKALVMTEAGRLREELASLSVGGRNLALGTSKEWSSPFTNFSGNQNFWSPLYKVLTDGLQVGDTLRSKIILKYTDVRPAPGKTATVWLQGNGNVTGWAAGTYNGSPAKTLNGSGEITFEHSFKITENHLKNAYWNWMFRTDYIASGSLQWKLAKVESGSVFTSWSPAPEDADGLITEAKAVFERTVEGRFATISQQIADKANQTEFQRVQETSKLYERLIGSTEKEVIDKVSRMALTNELFQVEVSKNLDLRTVQYQMANAWAVQNLNSNGDIISQINMTGPNVRIQGESIHLDGKTLIDNGIIKNAMIESMIADKITAGTLNAANVNIVNLNASKIVGLDANFIKSKIELAFIEWMKGKVITAQNDAMKIDLNAGQINYYTDKAALKRVLTGYPNQFVKFATGKVVGKGLAGVTIIGSNRYGNESSDDGGFVGIRAWNGPDIDQVDIVGDTVRLTSSPFESADGWDVITLPNKLEIDAHNVNHRVSSRMKVGDVWLWKNASTYSSMRETINLIIDNLQLLHNNKTTEKGYNYTMPAKV
jgi:phage minor structural protein, N-terminal domain protein